jgi:Spy/CpxP family protein refolding chaperone
MKRLAILLAAALSLPVAAAAQPAPPPGSGPGQPGPGGHGPGFGPGPGDWDGPGHGPRDHKKAKLALTLGLAEALDLDEAQALKLRDTIERFEKQRVPLMQQQRDAMQLLKAAASSERSDAATVDGAVKRLHEGRQAMLVQDKELVDGIGKDLSPQKRARAVLFLAKFHQRMMQRGPEGRMGPRGHGPGRGPMGFEPPAPPREGGEAVGMLEEVPDEEP